MTPIRVIVADDEALARERVTTLVRETPGLALVGEAAHGLEALDLVTSLEPDLLFLDVEMPELNGFDVVAALDDEALPGIVFVTAYDEYAIKAFEVNAIDYLLKPVSPERFAATVERALARLDGPGPSRREAVRGAATGRVRGYRTRFVVRRGSRHTFVGANEVSWIDAVDNYLQLHVGGRPQLVRGTMKDAERELDPAVFVRIHRSAIVNVNRVATIETLPTGGYVVRMDDGAKVRTSRQYAGVVRALISPFPR